MRSDTRWGSLPAALALSLLCTSGANAAYRIAVDVDTPQLTSACALGAACAAYSMPFPIVSDFGTFNGIHIYQNGIVSLGGALPPGASVAGGAASLGGAFLAAGFADYSSITPFDPLLTAPLVYVTQVIDGYDDGAGPVTGELRVAWVIPQTEPVPGGGLVDGAIWELRFKDLSLSRFNVPGRDLSRVGDVAVEFGYGNDLGSYAGLPTSTQPFLPFDALVGWQVGGLQNLRVLSSAEDGGELELRLDLTAASVPEPGVWAMLIVGLGGAGLMLRRRRADAAAA